MTKDVYIISASSDAIRGQSEDALNPLDLYELIEDMEGIEFISADVPDLFSVEATRQAMGELSRKAVGWAVYPGPPKATRLPPFRPPQWLDRPPEWNNPRSEQDELNLRPDFEDAIAQNDAPKKRYILQATSGSATHPRFVQSVIEQVAGAEIVEADLPFRWTIDATEEAIEEIMFDIQGWSATLESGEPARPKPARPSNPGF